MAPEPVLSLSKLLADADLLSYEYKLRNQLKLRHAGDLAYTEERDLTDIGMSRPEQKRLRKEYLKHFPPDTLVGKLKKKVFGRNESAKKADVKEEDAEQHVIPVERITLCKELGKGEFGSVFQASWNCSSNGLENLQVAVKCVSSDKLMSNPASFLQEAAIMHKMRHENVVRLFGVVLETKSVMLVSELAPCGSLLECLNKQALRDSFPVDVLCEFALQIAKGMEYLASQRLIHRDLAARNVLVFSENKVKISDFGLSRSLGVGEDYYRSEFSPTLKLPISWCAPECINYLKFTTASDVWAYAVTLWEMFSYGQMPWYGYTGAQILDAVDNKKIKLECPDACPSDFYQFMCQCWAHDPDRRPSFTDLVKTLPEIMPQILKAVCDCHDGVLDHLQFAKHEKIILVDRAPSAYPDGYYWKGSIKGGKTGLFRPNETVAYLGAENPASKSLLSSKTNIVKPVESKATEKKKIIISEPQGDLRHTCHVGIDGRSFGLLQVDKNDLSKALPPSISPSPSLSRRSPSAPLSPPMALRQTHQRSSPGSISPCSVNFRSSTTCSPASSRAPSLPPVLPPKPGHRIPPSAPSMSTLGSEIHTDMTIETTLDSQGSLDLLLNVPRGRPALNGHRASDELDRALADMNNEISQFSLTSSLDTSDTRPLIKKSSTQEPERPPKSKKAREYIVRPMTTEESQKWNEKVAKEQEKIEKSLQNEWKKEEKRRASIKSTPEEKHEPETRTFSDSIASACLLDTWSQEAQDAYKLLVQCGDGLKYQPIPSAPAPPRPPPLPQREDQREDNGHLSSDTDTEATVVQRKPSLPKSSPFPVPSGKVESVQAKNKSIVVQELAEDEQSPLRQLRNSNGSFRAPITPLTTKKPPPPVPPKPKTRVISPLNEYASGGGFAPSVAKTVLFSERQTDDIIKF
uniref:non-specific protein-tyrosine kinase n=1 Tax=Steinernema glaseri TaxID=37863 RepID=A0A1I8A4B2_9BILA